MLKKQKGRNEGQPLFQQGHKADPKHYAVICAFASLIVAQTTAPHFGPVTATLHTRGNSMKGNTFGMWGIAVGGVALILALVHFWAGPFAPQPSLESVVSEKAASIRKATIDALKGKPVEQSRVAAKYDADKIIQIVTALLGGIAFILAAISFSNHESKRTAGSAAALGLTAIAFQFIAMFAMALIVVILIAAVLSSLGGG